MVVFNGGYGRTRTYYPYIKSVMLYLMSYIPIYRLVGGEGIEPTRVVRHEIYSLAPLLTGLPAHIGDESRI